MRARVQALGWKRTACLGVAKIEDGQLTLSRGLRSWTDSRRAIVKDIDGIDQALEVLKPHWGEIEKHFDQQNTRFLDLSANDHSAIGRILLVHLVVESFLDAFLEQHLTVEDIRPLRLSFYQKTSLLPSQDSSASFVKPGILQLNSIRNKFGHQLGYAIETHHLSAIYAVLASARAGVEFASHVEAIEAFAPVACAFLAVPPKELQKVFLKAFADLKAYEPESLADDRIKVEGHAPTHQATNDDL